MGPIDAVRDSQYPLSVAPRMDDTRRPTRTQAGATGLRVVAADDPGGPWLVRDHAGADCAWIGADGRICDAAMRYGGRAADVLLAWLLETAAPGVALRDDQVSARARDLLGPRRLARLAKVGLLAPTERVAPILPEIVAATTAPFDAPTAAAAPFDAPTAPPSAPLEAPTAPMEARHAKRRLLTPMGQVSLFGGSRG